MTSFIEDFSSIKANLARLEEAKKPKVEVTEDKVSDWVEYGGMYGWPKTVPDDLSA